MRKGAIILCGGKSSRMGRDKVTLPFGPELMLQRVVRLIAEAVELKNTVVVAAPNQSLPDLPIGVQVARDVQPHRGPLAGMAIGLRTLADRADAVYATACDVPLLIPAFVNRMFDLLDDFDIVVPFDDQRHHPLAAAYRPTVLAHVQKLLDSGRMSPRFLFDEAPTRQIPVDELRDVDPRLSTLQNLNCQEDYFAALATAGFAGSPDA
jgi:molybdopterin-guanine dinucleotide biosynthesis protein A